MNNQVLQMNRDQAEKLAELGYHLHQFRQKQRLTLEEVAAKTMIPRRVLTAIETGDLGQLPEPVYIQGFLRRYADAIGIDGFEFASAFPTQTPVRSPKPLWKSGFQAQLRPLHLYLLYMVLVVGAVSGLSYILNRSTSPQMVGLVDTAQPPLPTSSSQTSVKSTTNPSEPLPTSPQKAIRVGMNLTAQSWIRVEVDGKPEFEGVLPEGAQRLWMADKEVNLRAGNAGGVMVSFNDGQAKPLGAPGTVEEVSFSKEQTDDTATVSDSSNSLTASRSRNF